MYRRIPTIIAIIVCLAFLAGTFWLWRGFWRTEQLNKNLKKVIEQEKIAEKNTPRPQPVVPTTTPIIINTSTEPNIVSSTAKITAKLPTSTTLRVAISPLTGTLVLGDGDINLSVPFTSQAPERNWDQPWQDACEEAAVLMLDAYYKGYGLSPLSAKDELQRMINWESAKGWGNSIEIAQIKELLTEFLGYKRTVRVIEDPTVEQIKQFVAAGTPVLVVGDGKTLPNRYYSNGGPEYHAFIIRGYTADKFITNDPGVNRGTNFVFPIESVMNSMHDWNEGGVKQGRKVVLVVE